jgi:hypothetical protein
MTALRHDYSKPSIDQESRETTATSHRGLVRGDRNCSGLIKPPVRRGDPAPGFEERLAAHSFSGAPEASPPDTDRSSSQAIHRWLTARQAKPPVEERRQRRDPGERKIEEAFTDQSRCAGLETRRARPRLGTCPTCFGPPGCSPAEPGPAPRSAREGAELVPNRLERPSCARHTKQERKIAKKSAEA